MTPELKKTIKTRISTLTKKRDEINAYLNTPTTNESAYTHRMLLTQLAELSMRIEMLEARLS